MAYTVLARRYRSKTFDEVVGQGPIATTLQNAIAAGRIHHGYLFTGTRGVGKTSMARILAKALNCLNADAPTGTPCSACDACTAIAQGQDIDVVEIDAASHTGVDHIRELRSNAAYRPARSRFKIYIIDEVHMLSTGAFNALLKTLEEPPEHVKFILATTEIHKVPATIQSRCQRFNFRNIAQEEIAAALDRVCTAEGATTDERVVQRVARLANGSMRDALSILDQLLSLSPTKVTATVLEEVLPPAQDEQLAELMRHAAQGESAATLQMLDQVLAGGRGLEALCTDTIELLRTLMVLRVCGPDSDLVDLPTAMRKDYAALADQFAVSHYVQMIAMLEELRRNVRFSGAGRALADALMVRFSKMAAWGSIETLLGSASDEKKNVPALVGSARTHAPEHPPEAAGRSSQTLTAPVDASSLDGGSVTPREMSPDGVITEATADVGSRALFSAGLPPADHPESVSDAMEAEPSDEGPAPEAPTERVAVTINEALRRQITGDALVQQALDLFGGRLTNVVRRQAAPTVGDDETE